MTQVREIPVGVGPERAAAHRLYMRHHFRISSHHFQLEL